MYKRAQTKEYIFDNTLLNIKYKYLPLKL